jgi:hypothetical protein
MKKPSLRSDLARLRRLSWRGWVILLEATMLLGASRACVLAFPYRRIMTLPGQRRGERAIAAPPQLIVQHVAWAVRAASRRTPWNSNCLAQALAGQIMLGRRGVASTIHFGVMREASGKLAAHAWLSAGDVFVTGNYGLEQYAEVAQFARGAGG